MVSTLLCFIGSPLHNSRSLNVPVCWQQTGTLKPASGASIDQMCALPENREHRGGFCFDRGSPCLDSPLMIYGHDENIKGSPGTLRLLTTFDTRIVDETGTADSEVDAETVFDIREVEVGSITPMYIKL